MIIVHHVRRDLARDTRLGVTHPMIENFEAAMADGTFNQKLTAMRVAAASALLLADGYEKVAQVDGQDRNRAFTLTNNITSSWSLEPVEGVRPEGLGYIVGNDGEHYAYRSTSVGDVFEDTVTGTKYVVDSFGFAAL